jgi:excisionase family DNA binding protein
MTTTAPTPTDWRQKVTITVPEAAELLGLGRNSGYRAAANGQIPVLAVGHRLLVPTAKLRRMLGELEEPSGAA